MKRFCLNLVRIFIQIRSEAWLCIIIFQTSEQIALIARFMGPAWGPSGAGRTQVGPIWPHELCYLGVFSCDSSKPLFSHFFFTLVKQSVINKIAIKKQQKNIKMIWSNSVIFSCEKAIYKSCFWSLIYKVGLADLTAGVRIWDSDSPFPSDLQIFTHYFHLQLWFDGNWKLLPWFLQPEMQQYAGISQDCVSKWLCLSAFFGGCHTSMKFGAQMIACGRQL